MGDKFRIESELDSLRAECLNWSLREREFSGLVNKSWVKLNLRVEGATIGLLGTPEKLPRRVASTELSMKLTDRRESVFPGVRAGDVSVDKLGVAASEFALKLAEFWRVSVFPGLVGDNERAY